MKFSVATNFEPDLLPALEGYPVVELFGKLPCDSVGGGRASFMLAPLGKTQFRAHVQDAARRGIGFNYLVNPACMDNREFIRKGQAELERLLEFVEECGVTSVTVSLPFLLPIIKKRHPRLKVRVGVYARVDCVAKARFWEDLGADCITLESIAVNRDFAMLRSIRQAVGLELQLIANSNCLIFCPISGQHMVNLSHASQKGHASRGFMIDYCALKCSALKLADPSHYLRSEFIRPEDIKAYTDLGFHSFKILERGAPTEVLARRVRAYAEGRFDGNLLDLIQPYGYKTGSAKGGSLLDLRRFARFFFRPLAVRQSGLLRLKRLAEKRGLVAGLDWDPVHIDNRLLDGFLEGMRGIDCRSSDCSRCGYCERWTREAVRVDERYRQELLQLYHEAFHDMYSGSLWGIAGRRGE
ncbi:U32 family peptidase [Geomonas sp. Red69]|uniref:U32 family peptidase n=1 Tax=Geomonas diazotrophica TaxID=2843197 RepID=A0ABX8JHE6_9BACT|nr:MULTISPECIES: U32 family peptidase [Geomonas]MBU5637850.1 U32 family peptidase [Geomonas diazotrophica]QWV96571.1 U32 family peptidase [Geomonas nitrogeniifigens]